MPHNNGVVWDGSAGCWQGNSLKFSYYRPPFRKDDQQVGWVKRLSILKLPPSLSLALGVVIADTPDYPHYYYYYFYYYYYYCCCCYYYYYYYYDYYYYYYSYSLVIKAPWTLRLQLM